ncbi:HNH endonuclease signature motif containing protein [Cellulomonas soli]|uniref:HNH nuclease domain-containing protein n=1 Tax=Cellulomonas soli TaxID=931535 RepID=A0A512PHJ9_9CELL|nr:HNH endonuclease signature motif containing protein [Cellulomonas soli]NYI59162.1 hypothetical protein [Cellulomonas soli]GEP70666.1 hypothetical protein CSO01_33810 [Cellulomonas soli]
MTATASPTITPAHESTACRSAGCPGRPSASRDGWCQRHHGLVRATGVEAWTGAVPRPPRTAAVAERLAAYTVVSPAGCYLWTGGVTSAGYGIVAAPEFGLRWVLVHRLAYELARGPIPEGLVIDHLCRQTTCLRVEHLEPVTVGENTRRGVAARRAEREAIAVAA